MFIKSPLKVLSILFITLLLIFNCTSLQASEYQPLILDIPASSYNEEGTIEYVIKKGDTLYSIGRIYSSDASLIAAINDIPNPDRIKIGQKILVPKILEASHQVSKGETLNDIARIYGILPHQIVLANDIWFPNALPAGSVLNIPGVKASVTISSNTGKQVSSRTTVNFMSFPTKGVLTSLFGRRGNEFHTGVDLAAQVGTPIIAAQAGKVVFVGWKGNYGKTVIIDHLNGFKTLYGHNSKILVRNGQYVKQNETISLMGDTGRSTGPHLHFEIYWHDNVVNPVKYISR